MCNMIRTMVLLLFANCCVNFSRGEDTLSSAFDSLMQMLPIQCTCNLTGNAIFLAKIEEIRIRLSKEETGRSDGCDAQSHVNDGYDEQYTVRDHTENGITFFLCCRRIKITNNSTSTHFFVSIVCPTLIKGVYLEEKDTHDLLKKCVLVKPLVILI